MAFKLYVGNYPHHFTEKDVLNLFRDFDGIKIEKMSNFQNSESFSFLTCNDIDQVVSVIKKFNGTSVSGCDLIVRTNDKKMQEYVNLILENDETSISEKSLDKGMEDRSKEMRNKYHTYHGSNDYEKSDIYYKPDANNTSFRSSSKSEGNSGVSINKSTCQSRLMHNIYQPKRNVGDYETCTDNSCFPSKMGCKLNDPVKSDIYDKSGYDNVPFNKGLPKSEDNSGVSENKSTSPSRSMHNIYQQKHNVSDCETSNNSCLFSKKGKKLNNQTNPRNYNKSYKSNTSGNHSNSYQTSSDKNEHEYFKTNYNDSPKSLQKSYHQNEHEHFKTSSNHFSKSSQKSYYQTTKQPNFNFPVNTSLESEKYNQPKSDKNDHGQFKKSTSNFSGYSFNNISDADSQASRFKNSESFRKQHEIRSPTWVSVTNFRFGTSVKTFYELFSDYKPLGVKMICNERRKNKLLTEAHVCFPSREIADDVMLNFDNTLFEGRYILVNDVEDLAIMNELLHISHS